MEAKRLGLCQKSLVCRAKPFDGTMGHRVFTPVPQCETAGGTAKRILKPANRKKFCARIATGDYDAVIIGHSQFEKIPLSAERQERLIQEQIDEIEEAIEEAKAQVGEHFTVKQLEKMRKSLETETGKAARRQTVKMMWLRLNNWA